MDIFIESLKMEIPCPCSDYPAKDMTRKIGSLNHLFWEQNIQALATEKHFVAAWCVLPEFASESYDIGQQVYAQFHEIMLRGYSARSHRKAKAKKARLARDYQILELIIHMITESFDVDQIILFGSRATRKYDDDSDFDICVIADMPGVEKNKRSLEISKLFLPRDFGLDVIVKTPDEFEADCRTLNHICRDIQKNGLVLYSRETDGNQQ